MPLVLVPWIFLVLTLLLSEVCVAWRPARRISRAAADREDPGEWLSWNGICTRMTRDHTPRY